MKFKTIIFLCLSIFVNAQIELTFNEVLIKNFSKISVKKINVNSMVSRPSNDLKFWIKTEPRKLNIDEQKRNDNPNDFPLILDYDIYVTRLNLNCEEKKIVLYEMYQYDSVTKKLKYYEDYSSHENGIGVSELNDPDTMDILENSGDVYYLFFLDKCNIK